ncbi:putative ribonuclease H-like domain-containing protein [Tanacetum coccineum]
MVPRTVLTKSGLISLNTAKPVNTVQSRTAMNNARLMKNVNTARPKAVLSTVKGTRVNTARPKAVLSAVKGNKGNAIKASTCWVWRPKHQVLNHGNPQQDLKDKVVIDSRCSRHMTGNISYLTDYEEIDGGFVIFRGTKSISILKFTDESQMLLLKVPRKDNMYNIDLKNVVPQGDLKVKVIRCDNETKFKNRVRNQFCEMKGIKREFSVARTPQQNGVAERKNRTLIEAARTMLVICTDKAKITRKRSKMDKHGHGKGRARKKPKVVYQRVIHHHKAPIGQTLRREDTWISEETQRE